MPIKFLGNNRVLPNNVRAADVARASVDRIIDVQNRKYQAAFQVQGYEAILYNALSHGTPCACHTVNHSLTPASVLNEQGKATQETINGMLTGGDFKIKVYGIRPTRRDEPLPEGALPSMWEVDNDAPPDPVLGLTSKRGRIGQPLDVYGTSEDDPRVGTVIEDGVGPNGPADLDINGLIRDFDASGFGLTDVSCPMCFGTGYLGGFSVFNGWRKVLNFQHPGAFFNGNAVNVDEAVPYVDTDYVRFDNVLIPLHCVGVDAFRVFANRLIVGAEVGIDGEGLKDQIDVLRYADGKPHTIELQLDERVRFTHLELQLNQSDKSALFEFPKTSKSSAQNLLEATTPFTITMSPMIPYVQSKDIVVDSTMGKVFQVTTVNNWNDRRFHTLGWECEVRAVQPAELYDLLPRRRPLQSRNNVPMVRDNGSGNRRT